MPAKTSVHFVRNYTVEPIGNALREAAALIGIELQTTFGGYDNVGAEIATLAAAPQPPPMVVVSIDLAYFSGGIFSPRWDTGQAMLEFHSVLQVIAGIPTGCFVIISTFLPPFRASLPWVPGNRVLGKESAAFQFNAVLRDFVAERPDRCGLLEFERLAARLGENATLDRRFALMMKAPFKPDFVNAAAEELLRYLRCRHLPPKKVLVLDCDNTLWGGIVGEMGSENIQLDPYEYPGVAYYRFQSEILSIAEKGVLICLCSKNDEAQVWDVMDRHQHCLLRREHVAAHRINWTDKANNIKELALELNVGLDSMVYVDDNPAECELIRSNFPEVTVLQVPPRLYEYPGILRNNPLFDRISLGREDKDRLQYYQAEKGRRDLQQRHVDPRTFLRNLKMKAAIRPLQMSDVTRAAQLCQRTNQFNLTSKRYSESDLASFMNRDDVQMFTLKAEDRFGSMGLSGLIIWKRMDDVAEVDTFLVSCRIIGRLLDQALFCESFRMVNDSWAVEQMRACFVPTAKNSIVSKLWAEYGFAKGVSEKADAYACSPSDVKIAFPNFIELQHDL